jgi:hypothetical protein
MKLTSIILVLYSILFTNLVYSNDEFSELFELKITDSSLFLTNKQDIKLPDTNLTPLQRLHRYINIFGGLQIYISSYTNKFYIIPVYRLNLIYGSAVSIKILQDNNSKYSSLVLDYNRATAKTSATEVTAEEEIAKVNIEADNKISIQDVLTNNDSISHIISQLEYGIFSATNQKFLTELYGSEYSKDLLINFQHNKQTIKALISPYNSQLARCYLLTKLLATDLTCCITSACKMLLNKASKAKSQTNDTK